MKILCTLFTLSLFTLSVNAQIFDWTKSVGSTGYDESQSIALDKSGNVLVTGRFEGTVDFDPGVITFNLLSHGKRDVFIQKLDDSGNFIWAKSIGGIERDDAYSIITDAANNVFITGRFEDIVDFDPGAATFNLSSNGSRDIYVIKLDLNGNFLWAKTIGGTQSDRGASVSIDGLGNVHISGYYEGTVDFDPGVATSNLTSLGKEDVFILKLDPSGNFIWAKSIGGTSDDEALECTTDKLGNIFVTGFFEGTVDFNPGASTSNLTSKGGIDAFVLKLDAGGNFIWAKPMGGTTSDEGLSLDMDASGNIYVTGYFEGTVDFDPNANTFNLSSNGLSDVFIQKLNANGNLVWAKSIGGNGEEEGRSISIDNSGNAYVTGYFESKVDFDPNSAIFNLTSTGQTDAFIQKLNANGDFEWAVQMGGSSFDNGNSIAINQDGNIFTTGNFTSTGDFDPNILTFNLTSNGFTDVYIQKLGQCFATSSVHTITACNSYTWLDGNTYTTSDRTATHKLTNVGGCDSIITLDLTINKVSDLTTSKNGLTITSNIKNVSYQ